MGSSRKPWIAGVAVLALVGSLVCVPAASASDAQPSPDLSSEQAMQSQGAGQSQDVEQSQDADEVSEQKNDEAESGGSSSTAESSTAESDVSDADATKAHASNGGSVQEVPVAQDDTGNAGASTRTLTAGGQYFTAVSTKSPAGIQPGTYSVSGGKYESTKIDVCYYDIAKNSTSGCRYYDVGGSKGTQTIEVYPGQVVHNGDSQDNNTTWRLKKSRANSGVMSPQGAAKWQAAKGIRFSSLASSSPASIKPGIYLVVATASGDRWDSHVEVSDYSIGTGRSTNSRDYHPTYHQHYEVIRVNAGQAIRLDCVMKTHWQLLKSLPTGEVLTPQSKVYTKAGDSQFFSNVDVASSPQGGIPAGVYLVSRSQQSSSDFGCIEVSDFDANETNANGKKSTYYLEGANDYALVQVNANQRVYVNRYFWSDVQSVKWQLVKALPNSGVRVPRKAIAKNNGTYRVGRDISAGMYLVHLSAEGHIKVCDVDRYSNTETDCDKYDNEVPATPATYFEIVLKSGQNIHVDNKYYGLDDDRITSYWQLLPAPVPTYSVTFDSRGGSKVGSQSVRKGSRVARPKNPTRTGYSFRTWTVDAAGKRPYNFNSTVTKNLRLYAQWTAHKYTVSFNANGGTTKTRSKTVSYGSKYGTLQSPTRKGYRFQGWWTAKKGGTQVSANTVYRHAGNQTLYARWTNSVTMYRMYNRNSGEHFYTGNAAERDMLVRVGWKFEGTGWVAPVSGKPVYRLYNPNAGDHHYTMNAAERDMLVRIGWSYEGIGWYSGGSVKVLREYNPNAKTGTHNYTTNPAEDSLLVRSGWTAEGVGWYALRAK